MIDSKSKDVVRLLWTGGWDSTFRLLYLLFVEKKKVQPLYLIDHERKSSLNELASMAKIRNKILKKLPGSDSLLLDTNVFLTSEIAPCQEITQRFKLLSSRYRIGSQFEWLPRFAEQHQVKNMEIAIEKNELRPRDPVFAHLGDFLRNENGNLKLARTVSDKDMLIFKYFHFPLYYTTKHQMMNMAKKEGFYDLMLDSWFCHRPRNGKPCGVCHPCLDAMEEGFSFRVPPLSKACYYLIKLKHRIKAIPPFKILIQVMEVGKARLL